jgi:hypothetical protein
MMVVVLDGTDTTDHVISVRQMTVQTRQTTLYTADHEERTGLPINC